jgi:hypothetical protein
MVLGRVAFMTDAFAAMAEVVGELLADERRATPHYRPSLVFRDQDGWWFWDADRECARGPYLSEIAAEEGLYRTLFPTPSWPR